MKRFKQIAVFVCIVVSLMTMMIPTQAFAQSSDLNISASEIYIGIGMSYKLASTCEKGVCYVSSDPTVATVDEDGTVYAVRRGEAVITTAMRGDFELSKCSVFVDIAKPEEEEVSFPKVHYYQGDPEWEFTREVRKKACVLTSMAMLLKNSGIDTDPADTYKRNGNNSGMNFRKVLGYYDKMYDTAVGYGSDHYLSYDSESGKTMIKNPGRNYEAAVIEALERHPEGVICYFVNGDDSHAIVAIGTENGDIIYNDAGRKARKGEGVVFENTWCSHHHGMVYSDLAYMIAIN